MFSTGVPIGALPQRRAGLQPDGLTSTQRETPVLLNDRPVPVRDILIREGIPLGILVLLALLLAWNRTVYDVWLGRHDILAQWVPWNDLLGELLRSFSLPGWNPYQFSGAPFAGDAQSGWMYFPTMIPFTLWDDPLVAFKVKIAADLVFAVVSTYTLARVLGIGPLGAMTAAIVFAFGPLSYHETHCCTVRSLIALWIPTAFLGVELAARNRGWPVRVTGLAIGTFAVSQMFAGFPGQGALDASLLLSAWIVYRTLIAPPAGRPSIVQRLGTMVVTGVTVFVGGVLLDLAALWPRLEVYRQSTIATDGYGGVLGYDVGPFDLPGLLRRLIVDAQGSRDVTIAAGAIVLCLMAPFLARTRYGVPFFTCSTLAVLTLALGHTPLEWAFGLVPMWYDLHIHNVPIVLSVLMVGPAILAGASVDRLWTLRGQVHRAPLVFLPLVLILIAYAWFPTRGILITPTPIVAATLVTLLIWLIVDDRWTRLARWAPRLYHAVPVVIVAVVYLQPMGLELIDGVTGQSRFIREWQGQYSPPASAATSAEIYTRTSGPGGSGEFLLERQRAGGHFRYVSYIGTGTADADNPRGRGTFVQRRNVPNTQAVQTNGRSIYLGLYWTQSYNPIQLSRYADLMKAVNGGPQDYHFADLVPPGGNLDLLDVLNVDYVLVDKSLPQTRADVRTLTAGREKVFEDEYVSIWGNPDNLGVAWVTHQVVPTNREAAQNRISQPGFRPGEVAIVEGDVPPMADPGRNVTSSAAMTSFAPQRITYEATTSDDGFLVMSEIYEPGWKAFLDGKPVEVYPTDIALRGIQLPAGSHTVELRYEPTSLRLGFAVSVVAHVVLLGVLASSVWSGLRRRKRDNALRSAPG